MDPYTKQLETENEELRNRLAKLEGYKNILLPRITDEWHDRDYVLMHAVFSILVEFVEQEWNGKVDLHSEEEIFAASSDKERELYITENKEKLELFELYRWWVQDHPGCEEAPTWHITGYAIETEKMMRLCALRKYLWT